MSDAKTVVLAVELRINNLSEGEAELLKAVLEDRDSLNYTKELSIWEYSPDYRLISVAVE